MNKAKTQAKLPTLTNEELATLATMVAGEQRKRKLKQRCQRDYTLHREKRKFEPKQKSTFTPHQESLKNGAVREFTASREGRQPPMFSVEHFEQIFNKHHPGGSMMEDDFCDIDENEY